MIRTTVLALTALLAPGAAAARADTLPILDGLPASYTPGTPFTFDVRVPQLFDFTAFSVQLLFAVEGSNLLLLPSAEAAAVAPGGRYVFPSNGNFTFTVERPPGSSEAVLTFGGSTGSAVVSAPGVNDTLARVTVRPALALTGPITISVGVDTTFEISSEDGQVPAPEPVVVPQAGGGQPPTNPIPAPPGLVLAAVGGLLLWTRRPRRGAA